MATVFVTVAIIIVAMTAIFFTTIGVVAWFVKSFFITYFLFFFLLVVFHVMKGAKCVYQFLSPQCTEVFWQMANESFIVSFSPSWKTNMKSLIS